MKSLRAPCLPIFFINLWIKKSIMFDCYFLQSYKDVNSIMLCSALCILFLPPQAVSLCSTLKNGCRALLLLAWTIAFIWRGRCKKCKQTPKDFPWHIHNVYKLQIAFRKSTVLWDTVLEIGASTPYKRWSKCTMEKSCRSSWLFLCSIHVTFIVLCCIVLALAIHSAYCIKRFSLLTAMMSNKLLGTWINGKKERKRKKGKKRKKERCKINGGGVNCQIAWWRFVVFLLNTFDLTAKIVCRSSIIIIFSIIICFHLHLLNRPKMAVFVDGNQRFGEKLYIRHN